MSLSAKPRRILRSAGEQSEVFVIGETTRQTLAAPPVATAEAMLASAASVAEANISSAQGQAAAIVAEARGRAASTQEEAFGAGYAAGQARAEEELAGLMEMVRRAAAEAKAIRDDIAAQAADVVARAAALAVRRMVADYYEPEPERTAAICAEALRAAAGQEILSIRVSPGLVTHVQATLVDAARYVVSDEAVSIGGCVIDLRNGRLDASLETRLSLMELAMVRAAGTERP